MMSSVNISYCCTVWWCLWAQESLYCWAAFRLPLLLGSLDSAAAWLQRLRHWWWEIARSACCSSVLASINPRVLLWLCFPISHSCPRVLCTACPFVFSQLKLQVLHRSRFSRLQPSVTAEPGVVGSFVCAKAEQCCCSVMTDQCGLKKRQRCWVMGLPFWP